MTVIPERLPVGLAAFQNAECAKRVRPAAGYIRRGERDLYRLLHR